MAQYIFVTASHQNKYRNLSLSSAPYLLCECVTAVLELSEARLFLELVVVLGVRCHHVRGAAAVALHGGLCKGKGGEDVEDSAMLRDFLC